MVEESLVSCVEVAELADELAEKVGATEGVPVGGSGNDEREEVISWGVRKARERCCLPINVGLKI